MWKRVCLHDTTMVAADSELMDVMVVLNSMPFSFPSRTGPGGGRVF